MANSFLQLNHNKTEVLIFGPAVNSGATSNALGPLLLNLKPHARNRSNIIVRTGFFHLRSLAKLKSLPSAKDLETIIQAFVSSCFDYCNSLYAGISQHYLTCSWFKNQSPHRDHISPVLASLHLLPVKYRMDF